MPLRRGRRQAAVAAHVVADSEVTSLVLADVLAHLQRSPYVLLGVIASLCERAVEAEAAPRSSPTATPRGGWRGGCSTSRGPSGRPATAPPASRSRTTRSRASAAMSRAHVSVVLGAFRERGLVDYAPGRPLVPEVNALRALVAASEANSDAAHSHG